MKPAATATAKTPANQQEWGKIARFQPHEEHDTLFNQVRGLSEGPEGYAVIGVVSSKDQKRNTATTAYLIQQYLWEERGIRAKILYEEIPGEKKAGIILGRFGWAYTDGDGCHLKTGLYSLAEAYNTKEKFADSYDEWKPDTVASLDHG